MPCVTVYKIKQEFDMEERDLLEGFENIIFDDFDESLEEFLKDNNVKLYDDNLKKKKEE